MSIPLVEVRPDECIHTAQCTMFAPEVFGQREGGGVVLLRQPTEADGTAVEDAVFSCPVRAIRFVGDDDD